jgi:hypothetical protein
VNRALAIVGLLASLVMASRASGAESSSDKLIEQGLRLRRDGKPAEALELFRKAHAIAPSPRTFGQMGLVEASLKLWVEGETHLAVALSNPDDTWVIKNRAFLDQALGLCRQHVGDLAVTGPAGAEISVDGKPVGMLPAVPTMRVVEGTVSVGARAAGFVPFREDVVIHAGERTPVSVSLKPLPTAAPEPPAHATPAAPSAMPPPVAPNVSLPPPAPATTETKTAGSWHTWAGVSLMAVGAVALGWGITWIAIDGGCPPGTQPAACNSTVAPYQTRTGGWILAGVGTAAIAGGATIFFTRGTPTNSNVALGLTPTSLLFATRF